MGVVISMALLLVYVLAMCVSNRNIPYSVSETVYHTKNDWAFIGVMIIVGLLLYSPIKEHSAFLSFFISAGFVLVGISPQYESRVQGYIHPVGASMLLLGSVALVGIVEPWLLLTWLPYVLASAVFTVRYRRNQESWFKAYKKTKPLFWIEVITILSLMIALTCI